MPIIAPDTSMAEDFAPLDGTYPAKILAVAYEISKKGNPMIVPEFEIQIGNGKVRNRKTYLVITGAGAMNFDQLLRAAGFSELADQYRDPAVANPEFDTDRLVGCELQVVMQKRMYNDATGTQKLGDEVSTYLKS